MSFDSSSLPKNSSTILSVPSSKHPSVLVHVIQAQESSDNINNTSPRDFSFVLESYTSSLRAPLIRLEYFTEGGANILFRIQPVCGHNKLPWSSGIPHDHFSQKLLRLRKDLQYFTSKVTCDEASQPPIKLMHNHNLINHVEDSTVGLFTYVKRQVEPKLSSRWILPLTMVKLSSSVLVDCNKLLHRLEQSNLRPSSRCHKYLDENEQFGLIIEHMGLRGWGFPHNKSISKVSSFSVPSTETTQSSTIISYFTFQFKPKWLVQSPNAPHNAIRCRTCALSAMRSSSTDTVDASTVSCPLALLSDSRSIVFRQVEKIARAHGLFGTALFDDPTKFSFTDKIVYELRQLILNVLTEFLYNGIGRQMLLDICQLQASLDPFGVLKFTSPLPHNPTSVKSETEFSESTSNTLQTKDFLPAFSLATPPQISNAFSLAKSLDDLQLAMTLRDCSLFVRVAVKFSFDGTKYIPSLSDSPPFIDAAYLADLDCKCVCRKLNYWARVEQELYDGCWYSRPLKSCECILSPV